MERNRVEDRKTLSEWLWMKKGKLKTLNMILKKIIKINILNFA